MTNAMAVFLLRFAASVAVLALWACSGDNFAPGLNGASQALVSALVAGTVADAQMVANRVRVPGRVYVAMPPGSEPAGTSVSIRNGEEARITVPIVEGGFDPV